MAEALRGFTGPDPRRQSVHLNIRKAARIDGPSLARLERRIDSILLWMDAHCVRTGFTPRMPSFSR